MDSSERVKTIAISELGHAKLVKISKRCSLPLGRSAEFCIFYVDKLKIDPTNQSEGNPTDAIEALRNDLVGFIRTQEKTKLNPMLENLSMASQKISSVMDNLPSKGDFHFLKDQADWLKKSSESQLKEIRNFQSDLKWIRTTRIDLANNLIRVFRIYLSEREKLNSMLDSKKIKELEEQTIKKMTEFAR
ncbi:BfmA/BtgA family mobilization protein [Imperialibacter roseus]|uniref:BfmA/BtgA family mobilization protein n=1 Tax=Imperialibacter roseus TaxID=1324217 RepID=A0ABZ0IR31_9BACT|nr:BfmA/BtgA family mobilization protein [Imperialibacter roseus]WOK07186.1 BfmA/BtgA family mobilization protein [Imperialibacter roseus]